MTHDDAVKSTGALMLLGRKQQHGVTNGQALADERPVVKNATTYNQCNQGNLRRALKGATKPLRHAPHTAHTPVACASGDNVFSNV